GRPRDGGFLVSGLPGAEERVDDRVEAEPAAAQRRQQQAGHAQRGRQLPAAVLDEHPVGPVHEHDRADHVDQQQQRHGPDRQPQDQQHPADHLEDRRERGRDPGQGYAHLREPGAGRAQALRPFLQPVRHEDDADHHAGDQGSHIKDDPFHRLFPRSRLSSPAKAERCTSLTFLDLAHRTPAHPFLDRASGESMGGMTERVVGIGAGAKELATEDMILNIGPQHPSTHGVLRLRLTLDGERIATAEPIVGYMHRGAEKLFEVRDYRQIIVLANRHDWLSAFANELGVVLAAERMLGMEPPVRAVWARTLLAELNRVLNHLMFLGSYPLEMGAMTPIFYAFDERERIQAVMEEISGGRMHYMFNRVGGLKEDLPYGWLDRGSETVAEVRRKIPDIEDLILHNEIFVARTRGVGVLTGEQIMQYGVSGPIARASGVDFDLRRDQPYLAYPELPVKVVTRSAGDCHARFEVLLEQVKVSLDLADARVDRLRAR